MSGAGGCSSADSFYREDPAGVDCTLLDELAQDYGVTHVVLDDDLLDLELPAAADCSTAIPATPWNPAGSLIGS